MGTGFGRIDGGRFDFDQMRLRAKGHRLAVGATNRHRDGWQCEGFLLRIARQCHKWHSQFRGYAIPFDICRKTRDDATARVRDYETRLFERLDFVGLRKVIRIDQHGFCAAMFSRKFQVFGVSRPYFIWKRLFEFRGALFRRGFARCTLHFAARPSLNC